MCASFGRVVVLSWIVAISVLTGCATYVPERIDVSGLFKNRYVYSTVNCQQVQERPCATFHISPEDMSKTSSAHFGIAGAVFPVTVLAGQQLVMNADYHLRKVFELVGFNKNVSNTMSVHIALKAFDISALTGKATLSINVYIIDQYGQEIHRRLYSSEGGGHFPLYWKETDQNEQISQTADDAFNNAFAQLLSDLESVIPKAIPKQ